MALPGPVTSLVITALFGPLWTASLPISPQLHALAGWLPGIDGTLALY